LLESLKFIMSASIDRQRPLKNQKALVTGASSGIGEPCALALGAAGADVVVNCLLHLIPEGRVGVPDDIARGAVWLSSDASDYVAGTTLFVDGGMTLYPGFATGG
jgi:NAD(P)-dependent dehydrogenase (short-subunit alcohol dehydrogenase family)